MLGRPFMLDSIAVLSYRSARSYLFAEHKQSCHRRWCQDHNFSEKLHEIGRQDSSSDSFAAFACWL